MPKRRVFIDGSCAVSDEVGSGLERFLRGLLGDLERRLVAICDRLTAASADPDVRDLALALYRAAEITRRDVADLLSDPALRVPSLLPNHLQLYRRWHEQAELVEAQPLLVVERYAEPDRRLTRFCRRTATQVGWPLPPPLISAWSSDYYWTDTYFEFICVPATEGRSLLGLPDLFHEFGHLLLLRYEPQLVGNCLQELADYIAQELHRVQTGQRPPRYRQLYLELFPQWRDAWILEFVSDMVATFLLGPAFGWQHIRLCMSSGANAYRPTLGEAATHPADEARLRGIMLVLEQMGSGATADQLRDMWERYLAVSAETPPTDYELCYPESLIACLARSTVEGCLALGLRAFTLRGDPARHIPTLLGEAWEQFRADPDTFADWERQRFDDLWHDLGFTAS